MNRLRIVKRIRSLEERRRLLLEELVRPKEMIAGSVYKTYKKCGNPSCRCARGRLHGPFTCLSTTGRGGRKLLFVRRADEEWVDLHASRYREFQKRLAEVRRIDREISGSLNRLRDARLKRYP